MKAMEDGFVKEPAVVTRKNFNPAGMSREERSTYWKPKAKNEMDDPQVMAKSEVAVTWCRHASENAAKHGVKPWKYLLIPHDAISENMTLIGLADRFAA